MAKRPTPAGRTTEIDVADDLFKEDISALPEPEAAPERERVPLVEEVSPKERPPLVEEGKRPIAAKAADDDLEGGAPGRRREERRPPFLLYYGVPAAGAALILAMGWTFAFIIRQGLAPGTEGPAVVEQARVLPPRGEAAKPPQDAREAMQVLVPSASAPVLPSISPGGKGDETDAGKIAFEEPFFIPLEGGRRRAKRNGPTVFLHLSLTLGLSNQAALREVAGKRSSIREAVFDHFNRLTPQDLAHPKGREQAKARLIARLSKEVVQGQVRSVYFEEFFTR